MDLSTFKKYCIDLPLDVLLQKYIIDTESHFFQKIENELDEFDFKKDIAETLGVHVRDIIIVGSGKLGFSLKPYIAKRLIIIFMSLILNGNKIIQIKNQI